MACHQSKIDPPAPVEICLLAGGQSSRMGRPKHRLRLGGRSLLQIARHLAASTTLPLRILRHDRHPGHGPLGGIETALLETRAHAVLFLACDMPFVSAKTVRAILQQFSKTSRPIFCGIDRPGFPCLVPRTARPTITARRAGEKLALHELATALQALLQAPAEGPAELLNLNTPADLADARARLRHSEIPKPGLK